MNRKPQPQESSPSVPAYIVTFSDMVTLLLTFFVLLISLAQTRDPELFHQGRNAFITHMNTMGLGILFGKKTVPDFGETKVKYYIANPDEQPDLRTIDAKEEQVRRIFKNITRSMAAIPSQIVAKKTNFFVTDITFPPDQTHLTETAKKFLTEFAANLQHSRSGSEEKTLYVLGIAGDKNTEKEQWMFSSLRAQLVADFLTDILKPKQFFSVYSWGAGPGGLWVDKDSPAYTQLHIMIAVLNKND